VYLARRVSGSTSVGLNAVAFVKPNLAIKDGGHNLDALGS
jgi:hypothetical protein